MSQWSERVQGQRGIVGRAAGPEGKATAEGKQKRRKGAAVQRNQCRLIVCRMRFSSNASRLSSPVTMSAWPAMPSLT